MPVRFEQKPGSQVPLDAKFRDESGKSVPLRSLLDGKPVILNLVYYGCPNLCTWVLNGLVTTMRAMPLKLGAQYRVITLSIDPHEQAPLATSKRRSYLARYGVSDLIDLGRASGWRFLTGSQESIDLVSAAVGFHYRYDSGSGQYAHPSGIVVLSPSGKVSGYLLGDKFSPTELESALARAGRGKISSLVEDFILLCAHYDPAANRAGEWILRTIRIAAILSVFAIVALIAWLTIQERRT